MEDNKKQTLLTLLENQQYDQLKTALAGLGDAEFEKIVEKIRYSANIEVLELIGDEHTRRYPPRKWLGRASDKDIVIVGDGPWAMSVAARLAIEGRKGYVIGKGATAGMRPSFGAGKYRQSGGFLTDKPEELERIQQFYEIWGVEVQPVESAAFFESEEDFNLYAKQVTEARPDLRIIDVDEDATLPFDKEAFRAAGFFHKIIVQRPAVLGKSKEGSAYGALNVNVDSMRERMRNIAAQSFKFVSENAKEIIRTSNNMMVMCGEHAIEGSKVLIAAGPYSGEIAIQNAEAMQSRIAGSLAECYDIMGAPTATIELPMRHPLRTRPMNVSVVRNGGHYAFGITEDGEMRWSLYQMERNEEALAALNQEDRAKYDQYFQENILLRRFMKETENRGQVNSGLFENKIANNEARQQQLLAVSTRFKSMKDLPKHLSDEEEASLKKLAGIFASTTLKNKQVEPYTVHHLNAPIIGDLRDVYAEAAQGMYLRAENPEAEIPTAYIAMADGGGGFKFMSPQRYTWTAITVDAMLEKKHEWEREGAKFSPIRHLAASSKQPNASFKS